MANYKRSVWGSDIHGTEVIKWFDKQVAQYGCSANKFIWMCFADYLQKRGYLDNPEYEGLLDELDVHLGVYTPTIVKNPFAKEND